MTHEIRTPPSVPQKNRYTGPEFYKALTVPERELLINKSKASDAAGAIFEKIKQLGLDFNNSGDMTIGNQMVSTGILIQTRLDELVG